MTASPQGDWKMSWLNALSTCWTPGQGGCVVWWDAWAAVGTICATMAAVCLGLAPMVARRQHAKAVARIANIRLGIQLLHIGASCALAKNATTASDHNVARINAEHCDSKPFSELIPYFDVLPAKLSNAIGLCIADIETMHSLFAKVSFRAAGTGAPNADLFGLLNQVDATMWRARRELNSYLSAKDKDVTAEIGVMATSLVHLAQAAEVASPAWDEDFTRLRILGRRT